MVPECVDMEAVHCGYCWPGVNHWSRRTEMGESVQCHSTRARSEWITQCFLQTTGLDYRLIIPFP